MQLSPCFTKKYLVNILSVASIILGYISESGPGPGGPLWTMLVQNGNCPLTGETLSTLSTRFSLFADAVWDVADPLITFHGDDGFSRSGGISLNRRRNSLNTVLPLVQVHIWSIYLNSRHYPSM